jgi:hypothetical protein
LCHSLQLHCYYGTSIMQVGFHSVVDLLFK